MVIVTTRYLPEGQLLATRENRAYCAGPAPLRQAMEAGVIVEGVATLCDAGRNLTVKLGNFTGIVPREEAALGIAEGSTREIAILARVGKPVAVKITAIEETVDGPRPVLSRRLAQAEALDFMLSTLSPGQVVPAVVTHLEPFGAFVDLGCGVPSMIGIENISVSRIPHPRHRFQVGQEIYAVVLGVDRARKRVLLSHKELLGTWAENAASFSPGMTVPGYVRGVKDYGIFVELTPNLSGLAEVRPDFAEGDRVSVYIKSILPQQMKCKLLLIDRLPPEDGSCTFPYFITGGQLTHWRYAPPDCEKAGSETIFG